MLAQCSAVISSVKNGLEGVLVGARWRCCTYKAAGNNRRYRHWWSTRPRHTHDTKNVTASAPHNYNGSTKHTATGTGTGTGAGTKTDAGCRHTHRHKGRRVHTIHTHTTRTNERPRPGAPARHGTGRHKLTMGLQYCQVQYVRHTRHAQTKNQGCALPYDSLLNCCSSQSWWRRLPSAQSSAAGTYLGDGTTS